MRAEIGSYAPVAPCSPGRVRTCSAVPTELLGNRAVVTDVVPCVTQHEHVTGRTLPSDMVLCVVTETNCSHARAGRCQQPVCCA